MVKKEIGDKMKQIYRQIICFVWGLIWLIMFIILEFIDKCEDKKK